MRHKTIMDLLSDPSLPIVGSDQGYQERADVVYAAVDGTDLNQMWAEIQRILGLYNDWRDTMLSRIMFRTQNVVDTIGVPSQADFELASEYGQPKGIRGAAKRTRGYSFDFYDLAVRYTWLFLAEASAEQIRNNTNMALEADNRLIFNKVMNRVFNPVNTVGTADSNIPVTVTPFWNADGEVPPTYKTQTFSGSHTHYLTSGNTTVTFANINTLSDHMIHHGHGPLDGTTMILLVNKQESDVIKGFTRVGGATYDFIPSANYGGGVFLPMNGGVIARPQGEVPGEVGTYGPWHVVEDYYIPAGYLLGLGSGGTDNLNNPVGFREHVNPGFRGLKSIPGNNSTYPLVDSYFRRGFGVGVRQRGAGVVMQVTAGSYAVPAMYA